MRSRRITNRPRSRSTQSDAGESSALTPARIDELLRQASRGAAELDAKLKKVFEPSEAHLRLRLR